MSPFAFGSIVIQQVDASLILFAALSSYSVKHGSVDCTAAEVLLCISSCVPYSCRRRHRLKSLFMLPVLVSGFVFVFWQGINGAEFQCRKQEFVLLCTRSGHTVRSAAATATSTSTSPETLMRLEWETASFRRLGPWSNSAKFRGRQYASGKTTDV